MIRAFLGIYILSLANVPDKYVAEMGSAYAGIEAKRVYAAAAVTVLEGVHAAAA